MPKWHIGLQACLPPAKLLRVNTKQALSRFCDGGPVLLRLERIVDMFGVNSRLGLLRPDQ